MLKGSCDVAKKNIILCIWCNEMCLCGLRFKKHYFPHTVHYCFLLYAPPFWNASIFTKLIVLKSEVCSDWPAINIKPWINIKPCLHLWSEKRQTTSATLHCSKLVFESSVANPLNMKTYLQTVSQKRQTVLAKFELPNFIETAVVPQTHCRLLVQETVLILHKMRSTHLNIWVELFWNSVEIQLNHWFLLVSSFGRPNKVVSLSQQNAERLHHKAAAATILQQE